jgi:serine/threonine protein kinase
MPVRMNHCDPESLRLLAQDRLPPDELTALEAHLESCPRCRSDLDALVGGDHWTAATRRYLGAPLTGCHEPAPIEGHGLEFLAPSDWPDSLGRLGTYEVKAVLGRGGMGIVLKAFDPALSRNVAIKVLSASLATCGAARRRFLREARAAAAVAHEHVVAVHAVVETAGLPFLVMEYVPGHSLQDRLDREGPLVLTEILRIGMQTAAGLAAAHAQGLVHRDVKPANILLENGVERVRLTDFGLARAAADAGVTQSGVVTGTPHYMAPEQARAEATDHRADLFSLGSTLYAMCTGHPPFRAESAVAVLRRVSDDIPRPIREINADIPRWLEAIIARLHAKSPDARYQTAGEVADVLSRCLAHVREPLSVALPLDGLAPPPGKAISPARRSQRAAALLALALCTCAAAAFLRSRDAGVHRAQLAVATGDNTVRQSVRSSQPAVRAGDDIDEQLAAASRSAAALESRLARGDPITSNDAVSARAQELVKKAQSLERELGADRPATNPAWNRQSRLEP